MSTVTPELVAQRRERAWHGPWLDRVEIGLMVLIWLNVVALILESVPAIDARLGTTFLYFERVSVSIFAVEYLIRLRYGGAAYATRPLGVIDLMAILPFFLPMLNADLRVLRVLRTFRVYRLFQVAKLGRYSAGLRTIGNVAWAKRGELGASSAVMIILLLLAAVIMYQAEHGAQPGVFSSIPATMWWAVATLTTVGYGDVYPVTSVGRLVGSMVAILGIGLFALPAGILGGAFLEEYQKLGQPAGTCPHCGRQV